MTEFHFTVAIETETKVEAHKVLRERLGYDEDYGFDYWILAWKLDRYFTGEDEEGELE